MRVSCVNERPLRPPRPNRPNLGVGSFRDIGVPSPAAAFRGRSRGRQPPPCFRKLNGTLMVEPVAPGASNFALRATDWMQAATWAESPLLLAALTESTSPLGATLIRITSLPD